MQPRLVDGEPLPPCLPCSGTHFGHVQTYRPIVSHYSSPRPNRCLQVLHDNQWVDIEPTPGAFVVNIGDLLQMVSNDKLKSVNHRVTANSVGPRVSTSFFLRGVQTSPKLYGPIKELVSDNNPPVYKDFTLNEYHTNFYSTPLDMPGFAHFKVPNHQVAK
ncbi:hypothetical protein RND81_05G067300 [Saponaria officinalis]|uniref:Fe2OG dioxygenase domain-containing protein n=1 Tax=Saponaria officinalis TaxID=3572 RepID=A0AAW1KVF1_SAPOF